MRPRARSYKGLGEETTVEDRSVRVMRILDEVSSTTDRLARRMGGEFVLKPDVARSVGQSGSTDSVKMLPL